MSPSIKPFEAFLKPGERILWTGKPKQGLLLRDADMIAIPMSIMLLGFASLLDFLVLNFDVRWPVIFFAVVSTGAFVYLGVLRFFTAARRRRYIDYCLTNKRVLMMHGRKGKLETLPLSQIDKAEVTAEKDGSGHVSFGNSNPVWPWLLGTFYFSSAAIPGFELIPDVEAVYDKLVEQLRSQVDPRVIAELKPDRDELN
jgi:hypothetical protein